MQARLCASLFQTVIKPASQAFQHADVSSLFAVEHVAEGLDGLIAAGAMWVMALSVECLVGIFANHLHHLLTCTELKDTWDLV